MGEQFVNKAKKVSVYFLILLLMLQYVPFQAAANTLTEESITQEEQRVVVFAGEVGGEVDLLDSDKITIVSTIPDDTEVTVLQNEPEFSQISYTEIETNEVLVGYVKNENLIDSAQAEQFRSDRNQEQTVAAEPSGEVATNENEQLPDSESTSTEESITIEQTPVSQPVEEKQVTENSLSEDPVTSEVVDNEPAVSQTQDVVEEEVVQETEVVEEKKTVEKAPRLMTAKSLTTFSTQESVEKEEAATLAVATVQESYTSKLGHIKSSTAKIYTSLKNGASSFTAGSTYLNTVYYIKKQAVKDGQTYYLISKQPSYTTGVVGWINASDIATHTHTGVDKQSKTFYMKGYGKAYTKAWGGSKDVVYGNLESYQYNQFNVYLTEKVGGNTWYRGTLDGKTVWVHSSYVTTKEESYISRLGHIRSTSSIFYKNLEDLTTGFTAGSTYTNAVYYIKKQAVINGQTYYLVSKKPSSVDGVVGWMNARDMSTHTHTGVDKQSKTFYLKGNGQAFDTAWGGSKNLVYSNLGQYKYTQFKVHLTEKVGSNIWYRGTLNGKTVWLHSNFVTTKVESYTSRLGHIRSTSSVIYKRLDDLSTGFSAGSTYTNKVYYIKKQAIINGQTYYLISFRPSTTEGVVGWIHSSDVTTRSHTGVDKESKTFYLKGYGKAYSTAWGGSKDLVHNDLSEFKYNRFDVHLTEKIGSNVWYRGTLHGKTVWVHSSYVTTKEESYTSRLGHLRSSSSRIYKRLDDLTTVFSAGSTYTNTVYYIKKQAVINNITYYLISTKPSSVDGVLGWVNAADISTNTHTGVDKQEKTFYVRGTGQSFTKAWGGSKDLVYNLSGQKNNLFKVNLTEKVGSNIWHRGTLSGKTVWIHESGLYTNKETYYNLSMNDALAIQMNAAPQTDKEYNAYVSKEFIGPDNKVTADSLNVRGGPSASAWKLGSLTKGTTVTILGEVDGWYQIKYTEYRQWVNASPTDVLHYLNPKNFIYNSVQQFQFLDLSKTSGVSAAILNNYLKGKGTLEGQGQAFIDAGRINGINDLYLVSHASLETGNGKSTLAQGVMYNGVKVYNMYGVGAYDSCPIDCGAKKAYDEGWTTPYKAIVGGAKFIGNGYINNGLNTLYKMRWNPAAMSSTGTFGRQYATDIGWSSKQVSTMYNLYQQIGGYTLYLDIPVYK